MTFQEIWDQLVKKNPRLKNDESKVEFTAGNLRTLLRQVYEQGQAADNTRQRDARTNTHYLDDLLR